jgi:hypothetical protein
MAAASATIATAADQGADAARGALEARGEAGTPRGTVSRRQSPLLIALLRLAPALIVATFAVAVAAIILAAGATLGYDSDAYLVAARNVLDGQPLYDPNLVYALGHDVFLYPPPFAVALVPLALLPGDVATWLWLAVIVAALVAAIGLMPVRAPVRWAVLLLAGLSWPTLYAIKLGQVGPLLLLALVVTWRWRDRPAVPGTSIAIGALIKVQPVLLFGWAIATGRWRAVGIGLAVAIGATVLAAIVVGPGALFDFVRVLLAISKPVTTPQNVTLGAVAYQAGLSEGAATALQVVAMGGALAVAALASLRAEAEAALIVTIVASQLISPILWMHYGIVLLIPTAFLLQRRQWWAVALPLAGWLPAVAVPASFIVGLLAPLLVGRRYRGGRSGSLAPNAEARPV